MKIFRNIFWRKKSCLARLKGVQLAWMHGQSNFMVEFESDLITEYNELLRREEMYWFQKFRATWFIEG